MVTSDELLITPEIVRQTLDALVTFSPPSQPSPLEFLFIVELYLVEHDLSFTATSRQYALGNVLTTVISTEYQRQRQILDMPPTSDNFNYKLVIDEIKNDAELNNSELLGWSLLYFRYVVSSFHISNQDYAAAINVDERTLRRYQHAAVLKLTHELVKLEADLREKLWRKRLLLQLPRRGMVEIIGREVELNAVKKIFSDVQTPHILVSGAVGVGKSTFVEFALKHFIDFDQRFFDQIVWIDKPLSIQFVEHILHEQLLSENSKVSVSEYFLLKRTVVILDDVGELQKSSHSLNDMLISLSNVILLITSDTFLPLWGCYSVSLDELSEQDVHKLASLQLVSGHSKTGTEALISKVWRAVGGNPAAVILAAQNLAVFDLNTALAISADLICANLFSDFDTATKCLWFILSLFNRKVSVFPEEAIKLWPSEFDNGHVDFLIRTHLVEIVDSHLPEYALSSVGHHFIQKRYRDDIKFQSQVNNLILLADVRVAHSEQTIVMIETILITDWLVIDDNWKIEAAKALWRENLRRGHWSIWKVILEKYASKLAYDELDLAIGFGVCLRCLALWAEAKVIFETVVDFAGQSGLFTDQFTARLELAILCRYRGEYKVSQSILNQLKLISSDFSPELVVEEAEVALDLGEYVRALDILSGLPESPRVQFLRLVAQVANDNVENAYIHGLAEQVMVSTPNNGAVHARVHSHLGTHYEKVKDFEMAKAHFSLAVRILEERDNDPFAMARAQSNLAALLLQTNDLEEAQALLEAAQRVQRIIKDHLGLAITKHNKLLLNNRFAN